MTHCDTIEEIAISAQSFCLYRCK